MKFLGFILINNRRGKYAIVDIKERVEQVYWTNAVGGNEAAYAAYRAITGATVQESHKVVKQWIKEWEGKK
jgi:hypothetical protein